MEKMTGTDHSHGSILISGVTGSGMSTSMKTAVLTTRTVASALAIVERVQTEKPKNAAAPYYRQFERK